VRLLTDATGSVTDRYDYDAFGNIISQAGTTPNAYLYSGEQSDDDLGAYYLRARYYRASSARFISVDPALGYTRDPRSFHPYAYTANNPVNLADPTGRDYTLVSQISTVDVLGILAGIAFVNFTGALDKARFGVSSSVAVGEFSRAMSSTIASLSSVPDELSDATVEALGEVRQRTEEELQKIKDDFRSWQLIIMYPTGLVDTSETFAPATPPAGPFIVFQSGGDPMRVLGVRLRHRATRLNQWIIRIDYHGHPRFPAYPFTLHFHVPPVMTTHYFLWPERVVVP
jgi:RHS repeat-associated protein